MITKPVGIILAAGNGKRFFGAATTSAVPKCFICVKGETLLDRQIKAFAPVCSKIIVVAGYKPCLFANRNDIEVVLNSDWQSSNTALSLKLAFEQCEGAPAIQINGDVWFSDMLIDAIHEAATERALNRDYTERCSLFFANGSGHDGEAVRVIYNPQGEIKRIGKQISSGCASYQTGEAVGINFFIPRDISVYRASCDSSFHARYFEDVFDILIQNGSIHPHVVNIGASVAKEIDTREDLRDVLLLAK